MVVGQLEIQVLSSIRKESRAKAQRRKESIPDKESLNPFAPLREPVFFFSLFETNPLLHGCSI
jgi:hypothetical protein